LRSPRLGEEALRDLIALHWRYQLPMRALAAFRSSTNERWFAAHDTYWHDAVFGTAS
jgi:lipoprotein-anchoring transpeptidase ErfK/SrfK